MMSEKTPNVFEMFQTSRSAIVHRSCTHSIHTALISYRTTSSASRSRESASTDSRNPHDPHPPHVSSFDVPSQSLPNRRIKYAHPHIAQLRSQLLHLRTRLDSAKANFERHAAQHLASLGIKINEVTGYEEVERLKRVVIEREENLRLLRDRARDAKTAYDTAVTTRSSSQRDVNSLLERKHSWNDADVSAFTTLVRSDHNSTAAVTSTSLQLKDAEVSVDTAFTQLTKAILERYHEEQVWSDKIRNVSTWAGLAGLVINLVVFIGAIAIVEPWKRRRLVERLEERIAGMMSDVDGGVGSLANRLDGIEELLRRDYSAQANIPLDTPHLPNSLPTQTLPLYTSPLPTALSPRLDPYISPSPERDFALIGLSGMASGIGLVGIFRWLLRGS